MESPLYEDKIGELPTLSGLPQMESVPSSIKEKVNDSGSDSVEIADEKLDVDANRFDEDEPQYRNGEPVITTGRDVSRFAVDIRDDEDDALTFRSIFLGTVFAGMGAALSQVSGSNVSPNPSICYFRVPRSWRHKSLFLLGRTNSMTKMFRNN